MHGASLDDQIGTQNLCAEVDRMEGLVKFAVEGPRGGGRKMVPDHSELPLLRGLRVALLKHAPFYPESLTWEGFFNRLLGGILLAVL